MSVDDSETQPTRSNRRIFRMKRKKSGARKSSERYSHRARGRKDVVDTQHVEPIKTIGVTNLNNRGGMRPRDRSKGEASTGRRD